MAISRRRAEFATANFVTMLRREWVRLNPGLDAAACPIKPLYSYGPEHRGALINAVSAAVSAAGPEGDAFFHDWSASREG